MRVPAEYMAQWLLSLINVCSRGAATYIRYIMFKTSLYLEIKEINCFDRTLKYRNKGLSFFGTKPIKANNSTDSTVEE